MITHSLVPVRRKRANHLDPRNVGFMWIFKESPAWRARDERCYVIVGRYHRPCDFEEFSNARALVREWETDE